MNEAEGTPLLSIGIVQGGGNALRFVVQDLGDLMRLVSREAPRFTNQGLRVNVIFGVPGPLARPEFEGVEPGRFYSKRGLLVVGASVPDTLRPTETTDYIRSTLAAAMTAAEERMRRKRVEIDMTAVRELAVRIGDLLPDQPLDGPERYREERQATTLDGPVRAYVELDAGGRNLRRIEVYADGRMDYAVRAIETGTTRLRRSPAHSPQVELIPEERFESLWQAAINQAQARGPIHVVDYPVE
jgi:hypothetical protein